jgi:hypothetical protein
MSLPSGNWNATVNGYEIFRLQINAPNQSGVFTGVYALTANGDFEFEGFWDEASQTITFSVSLGVGPPQPVVAVFKGFLFRTPTMPAPGQDVVATLTGFVQVTSGNHRDETLKATSRRNVFGWFARISEVN